jgi:hypothetical protein
MRNCQSKNFSAWSKSRSDRSWNMIDDKSVEEIRSQSCRDAQPVSKRQKTGKLISIQVA